MDFDHYIKDFAYDFDQTEWSVLNCLKYLETHLQYISDSKKDINDAFARTFEKLMQEERAPSIRMAETTSEQNRNSQAEADIVNSPKIEDDRTNINSNQSNDQINYAEVDKIIVNKIACLIFDSEFTLEEIWKKVMECLKKNNLRVQSIESRIVDLSNWSKVKWSRILKLPDYAQLFDRSKKKLHRDKIDKDVHELLCGEIGQIRSLNNLESWIAKFSDLKSIDAKISVIIMKFLEVNVLIMQQRERDFVVKILGPDVHEEYVELTSDMKKIDLIISLRSHKAEILALEVGNTSGSIDDTKYRKDHSKLKVIMKDCLGSLWRKLHFKKMDLEEVFPLGIQVTDGNAYTSYNILRYRRPSPESFGIT
ncbi:13147_t:CDS:10, partial [Funneliformis mosseae]